MLIPEFYIVLYYYIILNGISLTGGQKNISEKSEKSSKSLSQTKSASGKICVIFSQGIKL